MKINNEDTGLHWATVYNTFTFSIFYNDMSPVETHETMADALLKGTTLTLPVWILIDLLTECHHVLPLLLPVGRTGGFV